MRFTLNVLDKPDAEQKRRPLQYIFGGRVRTSTLVLIVALVLLAWLYNTYRPQPPSHNPSPTQVVPPGFVPDPDYTWVPRTRVDQQEQPTSTVPRTPTPTQQPTPTTTTSPSPTAPCLIPALCPSTTSPTPGPSPAPPAG